MTEPMSDERLEQLRRFVMEDEDPTLVDECVREIERLRAENEQWADKWRTVLDVQQPADFVARGEDDSRGHGDD
jgi:hypothetical protein